MSEQKNLEKQFKMELASRELTVKTGKLAGQANGSCLVQYGETVVLATAVIGQTPREEIDYFPLLVDYEERLYAAGKIKGSRFIKREGRPSDEAILTARLIDRSIRPLFKETERKDVQVMITVLSVDQENDPDFTSLIAASVALAISPIPWQGPIGAVRAGLVNNEWVLNPTYEAREKSEVDLLVAGTADEVVMIEASAKEISEQKFNEAVEYSLKHLKKVVEFIKEIQAAVGLKKTTESEMELTTEEQAKQELIQKKVEDFCQGKLENIFKLNKLEQWQTLEKLKEDLNTLLKEDNEVSKEARAFGLSLLEKKIEALARDLVLNKNIRVDGRQLDQLRQIWCEVGILPRTHGSALFNRGETQVLSIITLGSPGDEQQLDGMEEVGKKRFMHHYNFPGFSVGEVAPVRSPGRREIGHGALAEKALTPILPTKEEFPYTIRVVSEVLSSNGSSSQASACASSLALMDAGVPIKKAVAGIAMGLYLDPDDQKNYRILTDIQGIEDHAGDMDFKIAGTRDGITAVQLDIKLGGIGLPIIRDTISQAKEARNKILDFMDEVIKSPRPDLSPHAPRIISLRISPDKIREVIGPGGKVINEIIAACSVQIDIEDDGLVMITGTNAENSQKAKEWVEKLTHEVQIGEIYEGKVAQIVKDRNSGVEIGAIVDILPGQDGMVHISQLKNEHVNKVSDVVNVGDNLKVKVTGIDHERGRIELSHKVFEPGYDEQASRPNSFRGSGNGQRPQGGGHRGLPFFKRRNK